MNAKVGSVNTGYEEVTGKYGLGAMNDIGERFANLCAKNNLALGDTILTHKKVHKRLLIS